MGTTLENTKTTNGTKMTKDSKTISDLDNIWEEFGLQSAVRELLEVDRNLWQVSDINCLDLPEVMTHSSLDP